MILRDREFARGYERRAGTTLREPNNIRDVWSRLRPLHGRGTATKFGPPAPEAVGR